MHSGVVYQKAKCPSLDIDFELGAKARDTALRGEGRVDLQNAMVSSGAKRTEFATGTPAM